MAVPNMIVTLVANTTKFASGLRNAVRDTNSFSSRVGRAFKMVGYAALGVGVWFGRLIAKFSQMGRESRKANVQLDYMVRTMLGFDKTTAGVIERLDDYATKVSVATGVDDEQIKAVQKKLLVFKSLRDSLGEMGGAFDRTTDAAIDLAAAGFGDMEQNAVKLGRILQDPTKNLNALNRAGITFTEQEAKKIKRLQESGKLFQAQDLILKSIEGRLGGIAEKSATGFDKLTQQFNEMGDTIGEAINPYLEQLNKELAKWVASPQGKEDLKAIVDAFVSMAKAINEIVGAVIDLRNAWSGVTKELATYNNEYFATGGGAVGGRRPYGSGGQTQTPTNSRIAQKAQVTVNFNAPVDSVSAGREVARVLADYNRANGAR